MQDYTEFLKYIPSMDLLYNELFPEGIENSVAFVRDTNKEKEIIRYLNKSAFKKYINIILSGKFEEQEIVSLRKLLRDCDKPAYLRQATLALLHSKPYYQISEAQAKKGKEFLMRKVFTKKGMPRKGYEKLSIRDAELLKNIESFKFIGLHILNAYQFNTAIDTTPIYRAYGKGDYFDYIYTREHGLQEV